MSCCDNPQIESSTYTDWCVNCGWSASYLEGYSESPGDNYSSDNEE
jgi:hypothetical protein